jgi:hypothetical protein
MKCYHLLGAASAIFVCATFAREPGDARPFRVSSVCSQIDAKLDAPVPDIRIELAWIPDDAFVDPLDALNFDKHAAFKVTLNGEYYREKIQTAFRRLNGAKWTVQSEPRGYTKLRMRVLAPWEILIDLAINNDRTAVNVDGQWYSVDSVALSGLVSIFDDVLKRDALGKTLR